VRRGLVDLSTAGILSVAAHASVALALVALVRFASGGDPLDPAQAPGDPAADDDDVVEIELPRVEQKSALLAEERAPLDPPPPPRPAGGSDPRPDTGDKGRGGEDRVAERALNLADRDDGLSRDRSVLSRLDRSQLSRLRAGSERRSREDWRASRDPMEVTFFAMGTDGRVQERRPEADVDAALGARASQRRDSRGSTLGAPPEPDGVGDMAQPEGGDRVGGPTSVAGLGARSGLRSLAETERVRLADGRPEVDRSTPSVFANDQGKPSDTFDAEQEVAAREQSIIHASTAGGKVGQGRGGEQAPGAPGSGGDRGAGSVSSPLGSGGSGPPDPNEAARIGYVRAVQAKVHPLWANAFPRQAILDGKEGTATIRFVIDANGFVASATVARPSGIPEFDENVRQAVLKGAPYGPLPQALQPRFTMSIPFTAKNPAVRPKDPKEGIAER
jgi:TonB family protein